MPRCFSFFVFINFLLISSALATKPNIHNGYRSLEWADLNTQEDRKALANPPSYLKNIKEGSLEDRISGKIRSLEQPQDSDYHRALSSTKVNPSLNQLKVRMAGFIVPITFNDNMAVTQFFFVPYFGACIHLPPPAPNQIIFATYQEGKKIEELFDAFWIEGTLSTTLTENDIATAAYSMAVDNIMLYQ